jgi:copper chaperone CopZ
VSASSSYVATTAALASGLLASSCCVLQLALNAASIGCAGFSVLTPWRPLFRALTAASLAALAARQGLTDRRTLATAAAALALAASSDVLAAVNRRGEVSLSSRPPPPFFPLPPMLLLPPLVAAPLRRALAPLNLPDSHFLRVYLDAALAQGGGGGGGGGTLAGAAARNVTLRVRGVRCEACAARVRGALAGVPGVVAAAVDVVDGAGGEAAVVVSVKGTGEEGADRGRLVAALEALNAGYEVVAEQEEEEEEE